MGRHLPPTDSPNCESSGNLSQLPVRPMTELSQRHLEASRDHFLIVRGQIQFAPPSGPNPVRVAVDGEKNRPQKLDWWTGATPIGGSRLLCSTTELHNSMSAAPWWRLASAEIPLTVVSQAPPSLASQTECENEGCVCFHATTPLPVRSLAGQSGSPRAPRGRARGREGRSEGRVLQPSTHSRVPQSRAASTSCSHSRRK